MSTRLIGTLEQDDDHSGILELSQEAERDFLVAELEHEIEDGKQRIHERFQLSDAARELLPGERVSKCRRVKIDRKQPVVLMRSVDSGLGFFANVQRCGSVWSCPVCAPKITEKKRLDLGRGLDNATTRGLRVSLASFTVPHYRGQDTRQICDQFLKAWRTMQNRNGWREWRSRTGLIGTIRALEVTYGWHDQQGQLVYNGAHVHVHVLMFFRANGSPPPTASDLLSAWQSACVSAGLPEPNEHGIDIRDGRYAATYVGKWGLEHEMTKAHVKTGRNSGRTPWDLLRAYLEGDSTAGRLFQQHYSAFKGRRQLVWSKGLRELLALDIEKSDQELADEMTEVAVPLCSLTDRQFHLIRVYGGQVEADLCIAAKGGFDEATAFLAELEQFHGT
jgi:hypothetical protein